MQPTAHFTTPRPPATDLTRPAPAPAATLRPPHGHASIHELLEQARARLDRLTPEDAARELADGALLVDVRSDLVRRAQGEVPGSLVIDRNVLEWRLDPCSAWRIEEATDHGLRVVLICSEGYMSSMAAAGLHDLGLLRATDIVGGYEAWRAAGLPVAPGATMPGSYVASAPSRISLDPGGQRMLVDGSPVSLTPLEFRLLAALLRSNGRVVSREDLRAGLGEWAGSRSRSVDLHIHRIRRKLGPRGAALLTTEWGVGFRLRATPTPARASGPT
ncbi:winged helix-turn-helix domain-containing protein [Streptomyces sp. NPDC058470]|uniref:winged helix-turn-helix domain-containing protein n=1 Tax=Streptomyces sp. NPDC058470 TaxID=3346515 RepID=UPI00364FD6D5